MKETLYFAKSEDLDALMREFQHYEKLDDMAIISTEERQPFFAQDSWQACERMRFVSIQDAAKQLKARGLRWFYYGSRCYRRGALIASELKQIKPQPIAFPSVLSAPHFGGFTLLSQNELICSTHCLKPVPLGKMEFIEDKIGPPNRAYLKLWEALTLMAAYPKKGEFVVDLGASPGGWSFVAASLGAKVLAIDKAPLAPSLKQFDNIEYQAGSAFSLHFNQFENIDWLLSDVICYPERLLKLVHEAMDSQKVARIVATIKLQGAPDFQVLEQFRKIPGAQVLRLYHNKHELCFVWQRR